MYELFKHGEAKSTPGDSITEGIGIGRVTPVIATAEVDDAFLISDEEAVTVIYELLEHEGLCLGGSTGINIAGAIRLAKQLGPGKTIVTILCDSGNRYQSKLFNPDFMRSKNLPVPEWLEKRSKIDVAVREGVISVVRAKAGTHTPRLFVLKDGVRRPSDNPRFLCLWLPAFAGTTRFSQNARRPNSAPDARAMRCAATDVAAAFGAGLSGVR